MSAGPAHVVEVLVVPRLGSYGTLYARRADEKQGGLQRAGICLICGVLALAAITLSAIRSNLRAEAYTTESGQANTVDLLQKLESVSMKTMLGESSIPAPPKAFGTYDRASGYLVNKYWEPDFDLKVFQNVDHRIQLNALMVNSIPNEIVEIPALDITGSAALQPYVTTGLNGNTVFAIAGQLLIQSSGIYTFSLHSSGDSGVEVQDMKNEKNKHLLVNIKEGVATGAIKVEGPQMMPIRGFLRHPSSGAEPIFVLQYSGPDTDGEPRDAPGRHWVDVSEDENRRMEMTAHGIDCSLSRNCRRDTAVFPLYDASVFHVGFGCRFKYSPWKPYGVLPSFRSLSSIVPDAAAILQTINVTTFQELQKRIEAWSAESWNNANGPEGKVLAYCEGVLNVTKGGDYEFTVQNYGPAELTVEGIDLFINGSKTDHISLPIGFHQLRFGAIFCTARQGCDDDTSQGSPTKPILELAYSGPDTNSDAVAVGGMSVDEDIGDLGLLKALMNQQHRKGLGYEPERNVFAGFDKPWYDANKDHRFVPPPSSVKEDEKLQNEVSKIIKPMTDNTAKANAYAADGASLKVPDGVYTRPAPYDPEVVDIGGKGIGWLHKESWNDLDNEEAVIGKDYTFQPWTKTIQSVTDPSPNLDFHHPAFAGGHATPPTTFGVDKEQ